MAIHRSDIKELTPLLKDAFILAAEKALLQKYAFKVISRRSLSKSVKFDFIFFPGLMSSAYGGMIIGRDQVDEVGGYIEEMITEEVFHAGANYEYKKGSFDYSVKHALKEDVIDGEVYETKDYYIEGTFTLKFKFGNSKAGRASDFGEIEILYRGDLIHGEITNPRRKNPKYPGRDSDQEKALERRLSRHLDDEIAIAVMVTHLDHKDKGSFFRVGKRLGVPSRVLDQLWEDYAGIRPDEYTFGLSVDDFLGPKKNPTSALGSIALAGLAGFIIGKSK